MNPRLLLQSEKPNGYVSQVSIIKDEGKIWIWRRLENFQKIIQSALDTKYFSNTEKIQISKLLYLVQMNVRFSIWTLRLITPNSINPNVVGKGKLIS